MMEKKLFWFAMRVLLTGGLLLLFCNCFKVRQAEVVKMDRKHPLGQRGVVKKRIKIKRRAK